MQPPQNSGDTGQPVVSSGQLAVFIKKVFPEAQLWICLQNPRPPWPGGQPRSWDTALRTPGSPGAELHHQTRRGLTQGRCPPCRAPSRPRSPPSLCLGPPPKRHPLNVFRPPASAPSAELRFLWECRVEERNGGMDSERPGLLANPRPQATRGSSDAGGMKPTQSYRVWATEAHGPGAPSGAGRRRPRAARAARPPARPPADVLPALEGLSLPRGGPPPKLRLITLTCLTCPTSLQGGCEEAPEGAGWLLLFPLGLFALFFFFPTPFSS